MVHASQEIPLILQNRNAHKIPPLRWIQYTPSRPVSLRPHFNPLNAELNPIRHLLAFVGPRHIVHVSRVRVNVTCPIYSEVIQVASFRLPYKIPNAIFSPCVPSALFLV